MAVWLEALVWRLSQPGLDPSYGNILSNDTDEFGSNETDLSVDDYIYTHPYPRGVEFSGEVIVLPLASITSLFVLELRSRLPLNGCM